ncbi:MAG: hypothetical protein WHX53_16110 [Anaerolineae bacterium]
MRFLGALWWEFIQNLPMFAGFLVGARLMRSSLPAALLVTLIGILAGVVVMHFTEHRLYPQPFRATLKGDLVNAAVFFAFAVPFLLYFSARTGWIGWGSDIVLGVVIGVAIAAAQGAAWEGPRRRLVQHAVAMAVACPLIMLAVRFTLRIGPWAAMLAVCALFTLAISAVIVLIDYWPQLRRLS